MLLVFFSLALAPSLSSLSLFSVIFRLIGIKKNLVWSSFSEIAVIFIDHVFKNPVI